jgi:uncharacterized membrane protein YfcA
MVAELTILDAILFLAASFVAATVAGLAGFAFGLAAAGIWLHVLTPVDTAFLIVACGALVQGLSVWQLRRALDLARLWPLILGGALGVPLGAAALRWADPHTFRAAVGVFLVLYGVYGLARPTLPRVIGGRFADGGIGVLSGALGGATGLSGILPTIWCQLRGWTKDQQRAVFQPVAVAIHAMTIAWLSGAGAVGKSTLTLFALALPAVVAGTWLGLKLYGRLDEAGFRRVVLGLLLVSGIVLVT